MQHLLMHRKTRDTRSKAKQRREERHREAQGWRRDADVLYAAHWRRELVSR